MKARFEDEILYIHQEDLPQFKKGGGTVKNNFFWALKSIACRANQKSDWEFDTQVFVALARMLLFFSNSGYLPLSQTLLEFPEDSLIPDELRCISTWL